MDKKQLEFKVLETFIKADKSFWGLFGNNLPESL